MKNKVEKIYTATDAAELLSAPRRMVVYWIRTGALKGFKLGPKARLWRIRESEISRFLAAGK